MHPTEPSAIHLVEHTAKRWKRMTLYGGAAIGAGAILALVGFPGTGALAMTVGLGLVIRAKIGAWWHHG